MGTVKDVLQILNTLSLEERQQVADYLKEDEWDKQIEDDAKSGRLDTVFAADIKEFEQGKCQKI